jgi:hypothetical protein
MDISRKQFCAALGGSTVLLMLQVACGGGGSYAGMAAPAAAPAGCGASGSMIALNHGHTLVVPQADLDSMVAMTYTFQGTVDHTHSVTFTPANLQTLKTGGTVTVTSTTSTSMTYGTHNHTVTASCA